MGAALLACMIKGNERVTPILKFSPRAVEVRIHGVRQDAPPRMESISYEIIVDTDEPDRRLDLLHYNVKQYGTVFNTVAPGRCSLACCGAASRRSERPSFDPRQSTHSANAQTGFERTGTAYGVWDVGGA